MNYKALGETGVHLPEVGMGTWSYGGGSEPLRAGIQPGALFIDTAESYGSEPVVGQALAGMRKHIVENCEASGRRLTAEQIQALNSAVMFRRRSRVEHRLRRLIPGSVAPFIKEAAQMLSAELRRPFN